MRTTTKNSLALAGLVPLLTLALTGCFNTGSSSSGSKDATYDFQSRAVLMGDAFPSMKVVVPETLIEASAPKGQDLLFTSATIASHEVSGATYCAADISPDYVEGAVTLLSEPLIDEAEELANADEESDQLVADTADYLNYVLQMKGDTSSPASTATEIASRFEAVNGSPATNVDAFRDFADWLGDLPSYEASEAAWSLIETYRDSGSIPANAYEQVIQVAIETTREQPIIEAKERIAEANEVPVPERIAKRLGLRATEAIVGAVDDQAPEVGLYFTEDYTTMTAVQHCATSPMDDKYTTELRFATHVDGEFDWLTSVEITTMQNLTVALANAQINGFTLDANNDWIADHN